MAPAGILDLTATGTAASFIIVPRDATAGRPVAAASVNGSIRYNTNNNAFEGFSNGSWQNFAVGSGVGTVSSITGGTGLLGGTITSTGTLTVNSGTGATQIVQEQTGGQIQQNVGSAATPAYSFVGDAGNGFFSPGVGMAALSTYGTARLSISGATGLVGIGTTTPGRALEVAATGTGSSFIIVPRDTTANRPVAAASVNGAIRYNSNNNAMEGFINGSWQNFAVGSGVGTV